MSVAEENRPELVLLNNLNENSSLLEHIDAEVEQFPPLAKPENDQDDLDDRPTVTIPHDGVDDGFFDVPRQPRPSESDDVDGRRIPTSSQPGRPYFPYAPGYAPPRYAPPHYPSDMDAIPDVNIYQHKKTVAQGMMDLALFSANANQLRYVLENSNHPYYYPGIILISISLAFQVMVGIGLIWNTRYNVKDEKQICIANKVNNFTIVGIFLVTVINVFISAFGVATNTNSTTNETT